MFTMNERIRILAVSALVLTLVGIGHAVVRTGKEATLEQLTKTADSVIVGDVVGKQVNVVDRRFETDYEINVKEQLKGSANPQGKKLVLTVPGGELTTPPLTMYVPMQAYMSKGEEVVLFLSTKTPDVAPDMASKLGNTKLLSTQRIVGGYEGKFNVVTDSKDGQKKITRVNLEQFGFVPQDAHLHNLLRAVAHGDVAVTTGPVVDLGGGVYTTPAGKDLIDKTTVVDHSTDKLKTKASQTEVLQAAQARRNLKLQSFDEFKAQVTKFAKPQ